MVAPDVQSNVGGPTPKLVETSRSNGSRSRAARESATPLRSANGSPFDPPADASPPDGLEWETVDYVVDPAVSETFALETRAESLHIVVGGDATRRGELEDVRTGNVRRFVDAVAGEETVSISGKLEERSGRGLRVAAEEYELTVHGRMTVSAVGWRANKLSGEDGILLGGALTDTWTHGVMIGAAISDDLVIGGGVRLTAPADLSLNLLTGIQERPGTAHADHTFAEAYGTLFEREYGAGLQEAALSMFHGTVHQTQRTGFRPLMKVAMGARNLVAGAGGPSAEAVPPTPPAGPGAAGEGAMVATNLAGSATGSVRGAENLQDMGRIADSAGDLAPAASLHHADDTAAVLDELASAPATVADAPPSANINAYVPPELPTTGYRPQIPDMPADFDWSDTYLRLRDLLDSHGDYKNWRAMLAYSDLAEELRVGLIRAFGDLGGKVEDFAQFRGTPATGIPAPSLYDAIKQLQIRALEAGELAQAQRIGEFIDAFDSKTYYAFMDLIVRADEFEASRTGALQMLDPHIDQDSLMEWLRGRTQESWEQAREVAGVTGEMIHVEEDGFLYASDGETVIGFREDALVSADGTPLSFYKNEAEYFRQMVWALEDGKNPLTQSGDMIAYYRRFGPQVKLDDYLAFHDQLMAVLSDPAFHRTAGQMGMYGGYAPSSILRPDLGSFRLVEDGTTGSSDAFGPWMVVRESGDIAFPSPPGRGALDAADLPNLGLGNEPGRLLDGNDDAIDAIEAGLPSPQFESSRIGSDLELPESTNSVTPQLDETGARWGAPEIPSDDGQRPSTSQGNYESIDAAEVSISPADSGISPDTQAVADGIPSRSLPEDFDWVETHGKFTDTYSEYRDNAKWRAMMAYEDAIHDLRAELRKAVVDFGGTVVPDSADADVYRSLEVLLSDAARDGDADKVQLINEFLNNYHSKTYNLTEDLANRADEFNGVGQWSNRLDAYFDEDKLRHRLDLEFDKVLQQLFDAEDMAGGDAMAVLGNEPAYYQQMLLAVQEGRNPLYESADQIAYLQSVGNSVKADEYLEYHERLRLLMADPQFHRTPTPTDSGNAAADFLRPDLGDGQGLGGGASRPGSGADLYPPDDDIDLPLELSPVDEGPSPSERFYAANRDAINARIGTTDFATAPANRPGQFGIWEAGRLVFGQGDPGFEHLFEPVLDGLSIHESGRPHGDDQAGDMGLGTAAVYRGTRWGAWDSGVQTHRRVRFGERRLLPSLRVAESAASPDGTGALQNGVADRLAAPTMRLRRGRVDSQRRSRQPRFGVPAAQMAERPVRERLASDLIASQRFDRAHIHALPTGSQPPANALNERVQSSAIHGALRVNGLAGQGSWESDRLVALMAEMVAGVDWPQAGRGTSWTSLYTMLRVADAAASVD